MYPKLGQLLDCSKKTKQKKYQEKKKLKQKTKVKLKKIQKLHD